VILPETIPQTVEALGNGLISEAGERLGAGVDLDPRKDALVSESLYQRRAAELF
jgi:hypothetical protein